jgi:hypothetical protein
LKIAERKMATSVPAKRSRLDKDASKGLEDLPEEIILKIATEYLDAKSVFSFSHVK